MNADASVVPLVLSLGLDTFALSTVLGVAPLPSRTRVRLALIFAAAEGLMPAVGLLVGQPVGAVIGGGAVYLAGVLLIVTGMWILRESLADDESTEGTKIATAAVAGGLSMVGLALSVSLDELAMGFSFGILRVPVVPALVAIALQALIVSLGGQWMGQRIGATLGERAELLAGMVLCLLGILFIIGRLTGTFTL